MLRGKFVVDDKSTNINTNNNSHNIKIQSLPVAVTSSRKKETDYLAELKEIVFEEVIERIEKGMDISAADILDVARVKLKRKVKDTVTIISLLLKPIFLLFVVDLSLVMPGSI
jgi:hypothetical protein